MINGQTLAAQFDPESRPELVDREARGLARMLNLDDPRPGRVWVAVPVPEDTYGGEEHHWTVELRQAT